MIDNFCIVVNTSSSCSDIWEMFFGQLKKYFPNQKVYIFSDVYSPIFDGYELVIYDNKLDYRTQYLNSIKKVKENYCLNMNDDYILYDYVNVDEIKNILDIIKNDEDICQIRVAKGYNSTTIEYIKNNLFYLDIFQDFFFSQTTSIWNTRILEKIHELSPQSGIARKNNQPQLEVEANKICKLLNLKGLFYYNNEKKRGGAHYDSSIFPYIASALVSGKWNFTEYNNELLPLIYEYNINVNLRGKY
jgi:hypothetical protein